MDSFSLSLISPSSFIFKLTSRVFPCSGKCTTVNLTPFTGQALPLSRARASSAASSPHPPLLDVPHQGWPLTQESVKFQKQKPEGNAWFSAVSHAYFGRELPRSWCRCAFVSIHCFSVTLKLLSNPTTLIQFCHQANCRSGFHVYPNFCVSDLEEINK